MRNNVKRSTARLGVLALALGSTVILTTTTAEAASACKNNSRTITLPGIEPDIDVDVKLCVYSEGNLHYAKAFVKWRGSAGHHGNRFDNFRVEVRLERNNDMKTSSNSPYTTLINRTYSNDINFNTPNYTSSLNGGWTADGLVQYDKNNDGEGGTTWSLTGSPAIN
ncbi:MULTISPECIES: hypothetical protein [unclassified Streptomyces]|uniref:hypothetical protein n=1 Tax=unclassified Streptomyces TaxID=2593676 RepID=UPI0033C9D4A2